MNSVLTTTDKEYHNVLQTLEISGRKPFHNDESISSIAEKIWEHIASPSATDSNTNKDTFGTPQALLGDSKLPISPYSPSKPASQGLHTENTYADRTRQSHAPVEISISESHTWCMIESTPENISKGKETKTESSSSSIDTEDKTSDAAHSFSSLNTTISRGSKSTITCPPLGAASCKSSISHFSNTSCNTSPSEFITGLRRRQDISGRRLNPKFVRIQKWDESSDCGRSIVSRSPSSTSCHSFKALGKRPVGHYGRPHSRTSGIPATPRITTERLSAPIMALDPSAPRSSTSSNLASESQQTCNSKYSESKTLVELEERQYKRVAVSRKSVINAAYRRRSASAPPALFLEPQLNWKCDESVDLVSLTTACPFLMGPTYIRNNFRRMAPKRSDEPKVEEVLRGKGVQTGRISQLDWIMAWHLISFEAYSDLVRPQHGKPQMPMMMGVSWLDSSSDERARMSLDSFILWLKCKWNSPHPDKTWETCERGKGTMQHRSSMDKSSAEFVIHHPSPRGSASKRLLPARTSQNIGIHENSQTWPRDHDAVHLKSQQQKPGTGSAMTVVRSRSLMLKTAKPPFRASSLSNHRSASFHVQDSISGDETADAAINLKTKIRPKSLPLPSHPREPAAMQSEEEKDQVSTLPIIQRPDRSHVPRSDRLRAPKPLVVLPPLSEDFRSHPYWEALEIGFDDDKLKVEAEEKGEGVQKKKKRFWTWVDAKLNRYFHV